MHDYPKIFYALGAIVILFIHLTLSPSVMPGPMELCGLFITTLSLLAAARYFHQQRSRMKAILLVFTALCPALYYAEIWLITSFLADGISAEVMASNVRLTQVVYNLLRYFLTACSFVILFLNWLKALREFYANY